MKAIELTQRITLDPTCTHEWMKTNIKEYALPDEQIIFNFYGGQINIIDGIYYGSRLAKGFDKKEIDIPPKVVVAIIQLRDSKKDIIEWVSGKEKK